MGPEVKDLEKKLAAFTDAKHCIICASGPETLFIELMVMLGVGPGDEVVTEPFTFMTTIETIVFLGLNLCLKTCGSILATSYQRRPD